jgi:multidrug efflux pump
MWFSLIDACVNRGRTVLLLLLLVLVAGIQTYHAIPKEDEPDVQIPIIYVLMRLEGVAPEDAERLLIRPMEKRLRAIEGIKEMKSQASEGIASVTLEFDAGFDSDRALQDVREKVDEAKPELPREVEEPEVHEVNLSRFPVVNVILRGKLEQRSLLQLARKLRDRIETIPTVLSVTIAGEQLETLEILVDPATIEHYGLKPADVFEILRRNHVLIPAGSLDTGNGRFAIKLPGLLQHTVDFYNLPIKAHGDAVVALKDIAQIRRTFVDREEYARVNGEPAIVLEVSKRTGSNLIDTVQRVREIVEEDRAYWPDGVQVLFSGDKSNGIRDMLTDLQNNILFAVFFVMASILLYMGWRPSSLVALTIPGGFLFGILFLGIFDYTLNIVVLFSLILSIGMLVDAAIVVCEYADRRMQEGMDKREAYPLAAKRMLWPVLTSTLTILIVFMPLLFWPGIVGQFMRYMPITLMVTLIGSLLMALFFMPALGVWFDKNPSFALSASGALRAATPDRFTQLYVRWLAAVLRRPGWFATALTGSVAAMIALYAMLGPGVEFFPKIEPENILVQVHARGNLSVEEKNTIVREVESRVLPIRGVRVLYARAGRLANLRDAPEDTIGVLQLEMTHWQTRPKASAIMAEIRRNTRDIPGIYVEVLEQRPGPSGQKPIDVEFRSREPETLAPALAQMRAAMERMGGFTNIEDSRPIPSIEWQLVVDRSRAATYGLSVEDAGQVIKLVTNGLKAGVYRPNDADDEVDVKVRFPERFRSLDQLDSLTLATPKGPVPLSHFVTRTAHPELSRLERVDGVRVLSLRADVESGEIADRKVQALRDWLQTARLDPRVEVRFKGESEDQQETGQFLQRAFLLALFGMFLVFVTQFNGIYKAFVVLSAVFLSTGGVMLGLLVTYQPYGIVMCGVGIIALAGTVVSNNIIFIDTFEELRREGWSVTDALLETGAQRLRAILLTAGTTVIGLIPMVAQMNIDFVNREVSFGAPSTQWWVQLSTTIAGGMSFATVLTLFLTPCLLVLGDRAKQRWR